jgi:hypothetical protein
VRVAELVALLGAYPPDSVVLIDDLCNGWTLAPATVRDTTEHELACLRSFVDAPELLVAIVAGDARW